MSTTTGFRYNIERNGRSCCRSNNIKHLCSECRKIAKRCACAQCQADRAAAQRATASSMNVLRAATDVVDIPAAPDWYAVVREAAARERASQPQQRHRATFAPPTLSIETNEGFPAPPDFFALVRAMAQSAR